jgi:hypothetical protein
MMASWDRVDGAFAGGEGENLSTIMFNVCRFGSHPSFGLVESDV